MKFLRLERRKQKMKITRNINGQEIEIELTEDELQEATKEHFALQIEDRAYGCVDEIEEYDDMSDSEKDEMVREVSRQMVNHIRVINDDLDLFFELAAEYRKENGFGKNSDKASDDEESSTRKHVDIYTDGACRGNPGPGGWGAIVVCNGAEKEFSGGEKYTTNNRMELSAVITALSSLKEFCDVTITTDSKYVADAINKKWLDGWKKRGWKKSDGSPVLNPDLWRSFWICGNDHRSSNLCCYLLPDQQICI
jgi:ribonuclease HI